MATREVAEGSRAEPAGLDRAERPACKRGCDGVRARDDASSQKRTTRAERAKVAGTDSEMSGRFKVGERYLRTASRCGREATTRGTRGGRATGDLVVVVVVVVVCGCVVTERTGKQIRIGWEIRPREYW